MTAGHVGWAWGSAFGLVSTGWAVAAGLAPAGLAAPVAAACWLLGCGACDRLGARSVLAVAALLYAPFLATDFHSNDLYRYLWEGRVQLAGLNPYAVAPDHADLAPLRGDGFARIVRPDLPSLYPPLAQASFALAAALGWQELGFRNFAIVLHLALAALVCAWLARTGRPVGRAAWLAWSPVALAAGATGHVDVLMALALVGFAWSWERGRVRVAALCLALAVLAKTAALLLVPWALWRRPREVLAITLPALALGALPYLLSGGILGSLLRFAGEFRWNGSLHAVLGHLAGDAAGVAAAALLAGATAWVALRRDDVVEACVLTLTGLLLLAPIVHYWYLTWLLALLPALGPVAWRAPLRVWLASIALTAPLYETAARGEAFVSARLHDTLVALEYGIPAAVAALCLLAARRAAGAGPAVPGPMQAAGRAARA